MLFAYEMYGTIAGIVADAFGKLVDGHRIVGAVVVTCKAIEVFCTVPEFVVVFAVEFDQTHRIVIVPFSVFRKDMFESVALIEAIVSGFVASEAVAGVADTGGDGFSSAPSVFSQIVRDTRDCIVRVKHTDPAVFVKVDTVRFVIAGHKLSKTNRTGKRAFDSSGIETVFVTEFQKLFEFTSEKSITSVRFESKCRQCVENRKVSRIFSVETFNTDDRGDIFAGDTELPFDASEDAIVSV